jgi:hypothetical protein
MPSDDVRRILALLAKRLDSGTVGFDVAALPGVSETQPTVRTEELGWRRWQARANLDTAGEEHLQSHFKDWTVRTNRRVRLSTVQILEQLADLGFAWRDIARMLGVTVQALQKWRSGSAANAENKTRLAGLLAACDLIAENYGIQEVASWFEIQMLPGVPVTPIDLWALKRPDLVFDYASGHTDAEDMLTSWDPEWRDRYSSSFEVFRADDNQLSIRMKDR